MAEVTVSQFAEVLKVPVDRLLVQLDQAGIKVSGPEAQISDDATTTRPEEVTRRLSITA